MDSGKLPATLSAVYVGILSVTNDAVPEIADARLSSNVPLKDAANTFTAAVQSITADNARWVLTDNGGATALLWASDGEGYVGSNTAHPFSIITNGAARGTVTAAGNWTINAPGSGTAVTVNAESGGTAMLLQTTAASNSALVVGASAQTGPTWGLGLDADSLLSWRNLDTSLRVLSLSSAGGAQLGSPTGGDKGAGTLNTAGAIYQNNVAVGLKPLVSSGAALDMSTIAVGQSAIIYKTASTARTNDNVLTIDPVLQFTSAPAGTYLTEGVLIVEQADNAADFKVSWPRGVDYSGTVHVLGVDNTATQTEFVFAFLSSGQEIENGSAGSSTQGIEVRGTEVATAGQTLGPLWAQATSNGNATTMKAGSWLKVTRVA
jgi:hypothetical protein